MTHLSEHEALARLTTEISTPLPEEAATLAAVIVSEQPRLSALLFYGSGAWDTVSSDSVLDFYVLVPETAALATGWPLRVAGMALPPNVYFLTHNTEDGRQLRCKYAVMTMRQFCKEAAGQGITPQIWARFAQPCRLVCCDEQQTYRQLQQALLYASVTFHRRLAPLLPHSSLPLPGLWQYCLQRSYGMEWRSESPERAGNIVTAHREALQWRSNYAASQIPWLSVNEDGELQIAKSTRQRKLARATARLLRPLQKTIAALRLFKALLTYEQPLDYAAWKIARQSGVIVTPTPFQHRYPWLGVWPLLWQTWRQGGIR